MDMLKKIPWFFFSIVILGVASCEKKTVFIDESLNLAAPDNSSEAETIGKSIHQPDKKLEIDYSRDAVENSMDLDDIGKALLIHWWTTEFEKSHIDFGPDNTYLLFTAPEGDTFGWGTYRIEGDTVIVNYPSKTRLWEGLPETTMKWLFRGMEPTVLTYDKFYRDFDVSTCLMFGDKKLINYAIESPVGEEYEIDGFQVVKYRERENSVLILENLRMRKLPEITADTVTLNRVVDWNPVKLKFAASDIVYAGDIHSFDAKTIKTDTLDGITAPWYRITVILDDIFSENVWVFGGYVREVSPD
jgi:hypothetical protein